MATAFGSSQRVAERREPPGDFSSKLQILTGQLALFRCKVSVIWLIPPAYPYRPLGVKAST